MGFLDGDNDDSSAVLGLVRASKAVLEGWWVGNGMTKVREGVLPFEV
jgi:hypothetical protein